jgi:hypothetical protein
MLVKLTPILFRCNEPNKKMFRDIRDRLKWIGWINLDSGKIDEKFLNMLSFVAGKGILFIDAVKMPKFNFIKVE